MKIVTLAVLGVVAATAPAVAMMTPAPVKITSCVVARDPSKTSQDPGPAYTSGVTAVIVNDSAKTVKDLQISGMYNGVTVSDTIQGPIPPGQSFTFHKSHTPMVYDGPDAGCVINHVTYADGSEWQMPMPPMMH